MEKKQCVFCPFVGIGKAVRGHVHIHFSNQIHNDYPCLKSPPYDCPMCKRKNWADKSQLTRHVALAHNVIYKYCDKKEVYGLPYTKIPKTKTKTATEFSKQDSKPFLSTQKQFYSNPSSCKRVSTPSKNIQECDKCNYQTNKKWNLDRHKRQMHSDIGAKRSGSYNIKNNDLDGKQGKTKTVINVKKYISESLR